MARGRRFRAEGGDFDDVLDGKPTVVSDGGPYVYYFTHVERSTNEHPVMDGTAPGARMIEVGMATIGAHFRTVDPKLVGWCVVVMQLVDGVRCADLFSEGAETDVQLALLYMAVSKMLSHTVRVNMPRSYTDLIDAHDERLDREIKALPQLSVRIVDRSRAQTVDARTLTSERDIWRVVEAQRGECSRDSLYAAFEASFALAYHGDEYDEDPASCSVTLTVRGGTRLHGTVEARDSEVRVSGNFFTTAYVATSGTRTALEFLAKFECAQCNVRLGAFAPRSDARHFLFAARKAMRVCARLAQSGVVYPALDPIVTYAVRGEQPRLVQDVSDRFKLNVECSLDGACFFPQIVDAPELIARLNALLASCAGDAAWRARGLMAPSLKHAFKRSIGVVGESVVAFIHTHRARGVTQSACATLHVTRDAASRVVHAEITACGVPDSRLEARWLVPPPGRPSDAPHAAMLVLKLAQRLVDGQTDVEAAMRERCHVAFGAVCSFALTSTHDYAPTVQADGSLLLRVEDAREVDAEMRMLARRAARALVVRCKLQHAPSAPTMLAAGFRLEGPFWRKDY
jgi:hypothetical protein